MAVPRMSLAVSYVLLAVGFSYLSGTASAQSARRDAISDLLAKADARHVTRVADTKGAAPDAATAKLESAPKDPREGEAQYEQAKALMAAIDAVLKDTADSRADVPKLPSRDDYIVPPFWTETREDRNAKVHELLDSALSIVTNVPVVGVQKTVEGLRKNIRDLEDQTAKLKEKQLVAAKTEIAVALKASGVELQPEQVDLLLDSVLSGDLVRLVAVFNAAKLIDGQLAKLIGATGDNMNASRKYFAMHAALFAMLVQAQDATIAKIDTQYLPKLDAIIADIKSARGKTSELLRAENRPDQKRALDANSDSQKLADDAAKAYRRYLQQQREQITKARLKATHDLKIADNTYATVEASVQLRNLMKESSASFEAIQRLEAPSFEQIFKNDELRREFENLTRKLDVPSS